MTAQHTQDLPKALDLANWLNGVSTGLSANQAASELRRLHAEVEKMESEREANARLIAAAHDLLAVVKGFHMWAANQADAQSKGGHATFDLWMLREQRDLASAAIEKAERGAA